MKDITELVAQLAAYKSTLTTTDGQGWAVAWIEGGGVQQRVVSRVALEGRAVGPPTAAESGKYVRKTTGGSGAQ